jgi:GAF domain-containing protein
MISLPLADELSAVFARLSGLLLTEETVRTLVGAGRAARARDDATSFGAGVTLVEQSGQKRTAEATDERVERLDHLQYELDEGPCLTAYVERSVVMIKDTSRDQRFSRWSPAASGMGVASVLSAPLVAGDACLGAMKVYAESPGAFDSRAQRLLPPVRGAGRRAAGQHASLREG